MLDKKAVLKSIENLPDRFSIDELMEKVIILQKIEIGLEQVKNNQTISLEEFDNRFKKWLK